jgi:hypothetical protein
MENINNFNYPFCRNNPNPYHSCSEYCIQRYWPGNKPYHLQFCPLISQKSNHICNINCALKYGPKTNSSQIQLPMAFQRTKDPKVKYLIHCLMYYGYNP